jgi:hypothetical protein
MAKTFKLFSCSFWMIQDIIAIQSQPNCSSTPEHLTPIWLSSHWSGFLYLLPVWFNILNLCLLFHQIWKNFWPYFLRFLYASTSHSGTVIAHVLGLLTLFHTSPFCYTHLATPTLYCVTCDICLLNVMLGNQLYEAEWTYVLLRSSTLAFSSMPTLKQRDSINTHWWTNSSKFCGFINSLVKPTYNFCSIVDVGDK